MKNTASRILALIVALSMLLVPTAFAAERNAASVTVGNIELTMGEETLSLPLYLTLGGGADIAGMRGYLTANLSTAEQTALAAVAALENGELKAYLNGMNTGFTISLDQIVSMIEDEMGASLEDMMTMYAGELESTLTPEMQESLMNLLTQAAALPLDYGSELGPKDIVTAMGATVTDIGKTTVTLFDVEAEGTESSLTMAPTTVKAMYDGLGELLPEVGAIYTEYFSFMNQLLASQGEDMTIEQALEMITVSMEGTIYTAKAGSAGNVVVTISVEGESIDLYVYVVTLTDEYGTYAECTLDMPIDGEGMYVDVYIDDYTDETGSYKSAIYSFDIYDVETSETEIGCMTTLVLSDTEEGVTAAAEFYMVEEDQAKLINDTKASGGRVICVGTTSCRTLESATGEDGILKAGSGWTEIFIYPGSRFKMMDCLITNFHLPESTLLMLVSALAGKDKIMAAYEEAVKERYRFFSFGDAMFISD